MKEMPKFQLNYTSRRVPCPLCGVGPNYMCTKRGTFATKTLRSHPQRIARFKESTIYKEWQKTGTLPSGPIYA